MESLVEFGKKVIVNKSTFGETLVHVSSRCESDLTFKMSTRKPD